MATVTLIEPVNATDPEVIVVEPSKFKMPLTEPVSVIAPEECDKFPPTSKVPVEEPLLKLSVPPLTESNPSTVNDPEVPVLFDKYNIPDTPLNRLGTEKLRPPKEALDALNESMF